MAISTEYAFDMRAVVIAFVVLGHRLDGVADHVKGTDMASEDCISIRTPRLVPLQLQLGHVCQNGFRETGLDCFMLISWAN